jgi:hypothetical protein
MSLRLCGLCVKVRGFASAASTLALQQELITLEDRGVPWRKLFSGASAASA